jgi:hypothetical protein
MNSIEVVSNPEKKGPQQAVDGPALRVFVKEGNAYALQLETKDYQQAIKQAEKFHDKGGKDILVNEKDNPNIVHAKTNRNKDVDVGREIRPKETQGIPVKGPGEVVLASFYTKLPMDTKAFDEREQAPKDPTKAVVETTGRDAPKSPSAPQIGEATKEPVKFRATSEAPDIGAPPTVILTKVGYKLPEIVLGAYTVKDGKFHDPDSNALRFEDHGKKLSTPVEDRKVITHMLEVAAAKNWSQLELKGTETFKQIAWLEAQARGIETKGYKPNERDLEQLEKLRLERGTNERQMSGPSVKPAREQNEIMAATPRTLSPDEKMRVDVAMKVMEKAIAKLPENIRLDALTKMANAVEKGELKLPSPKITERVVNMPRPAPAPAMDRGR